MIVSKELCSTWRRKRVQVNKINGKTCTCCGIGIVGFTTEAGNSIEADALGFNLLLGYDAIKLLSSVHITCTGVMQFQDITSVCAVLKKDQPNFSVKFDQHQKAWTAS